MAKDTLGNLNKDSYILTSTAPLGTQGEAADSLEVKTKLAAKADSTDKSGSADNSLKFDGRTFEQAFSEENSQLTSLIADAIDSQIDAILNMRYPIDDVTPTTGGVFTADFDDEFGNPIIARYQSAGTWTTQLLNRAVDISRDGSQWTITIRSAQGDEWQLASSAPADATTLIFSGTNPLKQDQTWTWSAE